MMVNIRWLKFWTKYFTMYIKIIPEINQLKRIRWQLHNFEPRTDGLCWFGPALGQIMRAGRNGGNLSLCGSQEAKQRRRKKGRFPDFPSRARPSDLGPHKETHLLKVPRLPKAPWSLGNSLDPTPAKLKFHFVRTHIPKSTGQVWKHLCLGS